MARLGALLALLAALASPAAAWAHPLGNFTLNHYSRLEPTGDGIRIFYVLDLAEIPTFQEQARIDADRDGAASDAELDAYATARAEEIRRNLHLDVDGTPTPIRLASRSLSFPPGQGGLPTLRLEAQLDASLPSGTGAPLSVVYRDENEIGRVGWREIVARAGSAGTEIRQASVPATDQTDELRSYPEDLLSSPLAVREARLTVVPGAPSASAGPLGPLRSGALERPRDAYSDLVTTGELTPATILFSLMTALVLGALHALSPGHGKTVVAAYLVGARGTAKHALFLGVTVTATHTIGVYALGFVTLYLSQYILPERLYPILQVTSGLLVVGIGAWLFATRLRWALRTRHGPLQLSNAHTHSPGAVQVNGHARSHGHDHDRAHSHDRAHGHADDHAHRHAQAHSHTGSYAYADANGTSGIDHARAPARGPGLTHLHDDAHDHPHDSKVLIAHGHHDEAAHGDGSTHAHASSPDHGHDHPHDARAHGHPHDAHDHDHADGELMHSHGGRAHSHLPPGADGQPVTWRSLLALGVSGGLVPCPSALVVLLSAIALQRVGFGLLLIVAFSLGLAAVLVGIGLLLVYARGLFSRVKLGGGLAPRLVPVASALLIVVTGVVLVVQALPTA